MSDYTPPSPKQEPTPMAPAPVESSSPFKWLQRLVIGNPISSENADHTLLSKIVALPVFASDAISSVAYATQEIVLALGAAGATAMAENPASRAAFGNFTMLISGLIVALLVIVVISYFQTIHGYPSGGGSYIVSKDNLGVFPGLVAAAALLIDYVLTVSVSIAAGVQNLSNVPAFKAWHLDTHLVLICCLFIFLLTLANLRGLKESGTLFAIPTYMFVVMCYLMIGIGLLGPIFFGWHFEAKYDPMWAGEAAKTGETLGLLVLMKAFANGCSAMTGTEAVSNGIPAFRKPKAKNAAITLIAMGVILGTLFLGISKLAVDLHVMYPEGGKAPAVIDQISGAIFGRHGKFAFFYYVTQFFTAAILVLAANTSFADFPRLASILARDRFLPKQFSNLGDKLVFNNGILILGVFAALLIIAKKGNTDALIPLYAVGVFMAFTLSQSGMVVHWYKLKVKGWKLKAFINGIGTVATFLVLLDISFEKFKEGAWLVLLLIPILVFMFHKINRHYLEMAQQLKMANYEPPTAPLRNTVLVLVPALHRGVMPALEYARSLSTDCRAVHISSDPDKLTQLKERWEQWGQDVPLIILNSQYRSLLGPIMHYLDAVQAERRNHTVTVVVPEFVPTKWWHSLLHGQSGLRLKIALLSRPDVVVANVRYYLQHMEAPPPADALAEEDDGSGAHEEASAHGDGQAHPQTHAHGHGVFHKTGTKAGGAGGETGSADSGDSADPATTAEVGQEPARAVPLSAKTDAKAQKVEQKAKP